MKAQNETSQTISPSLKGLSIITETIPYIASSQMYTPKILLSILHCKQMCRVHACSEHGKVKGISQVIKISKNSFGNTADFSCD